jgi:hypothetical protein
VTNEKQWQPVRIAPEEEILKHHSFTIYGKFAGRIIRVRPYDGDVAFDSDDGIAHGPAFCGATHVFVVHPLDALWLSDGERNYVAVCEHQIQAD